MKKSLLGIMVLSLSSMLVLAGVSQRSYKDAVSLTPEIVSRKEAPTAVNDTVVYSLNLTNAMGNTSLGKLSWNMVQNGGTKVNNKIDSLLWNLDIGSQPNGQVFFQYDNSAGDKITKVVATFFFSHPDHYSESQTGKFAISSQDGSKAIVVEGKTWNEDVALAFNTPTQSSTIYIMLKNEEDIANRVYLKKLEIYKQVETAAVTVNKPTGFSDVYVSTNGNVTNPASSDLKASGTSFQIGSTVYAYGKLGPGYDVTNSSWVLKSGTGSQEGDLYLLGSGTVSESGYSFSFSGGTSVKTKTINISANGAQGSIDPVNLTYGSSVVISGASLSKEGYEFSGWNTEANGGGTAYSEELAATEVNGLVLGSADTLYAIWELDADIALAVSEAEDAIQDIDFVEYPDSHDAIVEARALYNAVDDGFKDLVSNRQTLFDAEDDYATLRTDAIDYATALIDQIGTVTYPDSRDDIVAARSAFDDLESGDQNIQTVINFDVLTEAEATYESLKQGGVNDAKALIAAIENVEYSEVCKARINDARVAYDGLTDEQKALVDNYEALTDAEELYTLLRSSAIGNAETLISQIGEVTFTSESKGKIDAARECYDALAEADKEAVTNKETLTAAEARYAELLANNESAQSVKSLISQIGTVAYPDSKGKIDAARSAYDALNDEAKGMVDNLNVLTVAESEYATKRNNAINNAKNLITAIGEVSYPDSKEAIDAALEAYAALLESDKAEVTNYASLVAAEAKYDELMQKGVDSVKALINAIGNVEYTEERKGKIEAARNAYDGLTDEQKALVDNLETLKHDEEVYAHLEEVVKTIESIGEVDLESEESIEKAKVAYEALTEEEKAIIAGYHDELIAKEKTYTDMVHDRDVATTCAIVFGIIGGILIVLGLVYVCMMFACNEWTKEGDKAIRVFVLGRKGEKVRLLAMPFRIIYREENEVFKKKSDALA